MKTIKIDFEIHQRIEAERRSFDEPEYIALRRLLGLGRPRPGKRSGSASAEGGRPFVEDGISIPSGHLARMYYQRKTQKFEGQFVNGKLVVDGEAFASLSSAACSLARTKDGKKPSLNGWNYWEVQDRETGEWIRLCDLRGGEKELSHTTKTVPVGAAIE